MALAERGGEATITTELLEGWFRQKIPVATIPGSRTPERFRCWCTATTTVGMSASATTRPGTRHCSSYRACCGRAAASSTGRQASPGGRVTRPAAYAGSTWFTDRFAIELDEHCVAQINCDSPGCRWATSYHETRAFTESAALASDAIRDIVPAR